MGQQYKVHINEPGFTIITPSGIAVKTPTEFIVNSREQLQEVEMLIRQKSIVDYQILPLHETGEI